MPRTRTIGEESFAALLYLWEGDGYTALNTGPVFNTSTRLHERITDYPGKTGSSFVSVGVRPVSHRKWVYDGVSYQDWRGDNYRWHRLQNRFPPVDHSILLSMLPVLSEALSQELHLSAYNEFSTQFPQEISIAEFTTGLLEIKSLLPKFSGDLVKDLAALKLTNDFGWQSVISDVKAFSSLISKVEDRLAWLRSTRGKPTRLGFYRKDIQPTATGPETDVLYEPRRSWGVRYRLRAFRRDYRAGATLRQYLDHLNDAWGYLRAISGSLGLDNIPKAVWETNPYSFVVDYFLNISARLDALTKIRPAEPWEISKITHSFNTYAEWDVFQVNNNTDFGPPDESQTRHLGIVKLWDYERGTGLPIQLASFSLSDLSPDQLKLLGALFAAGTR